MLYANLPLYIFRFLHQTTTTCRFYLPSKWLYIFRFLHQTTTCLLRHTHQLSCISFDSYIKPQLTLEGISNRYVVYLLIPTSNHNRLYKAATELTLYIFWFLHQTTTLYLSWPQYIRCISFDSYIKPQRCTSIATTALCCISFDSYIKPQRSRNVYLSCLSCISFDSYIKPQLVCPSFARLSVVYLLIPTSNHNYTSIIVKNFLLYIFWFLHQTTTYCQSVQTFRRCISFDSYIKPQLSTF